MILLLVGFLLAVTALVSRALLGGAVGRWTGPRTCGACMHALAPGQSKCPECGSEWTRADPGSAAVFVDVADRVERLRRTALVQIWAIGLLAVPLVGFGVAYLASALPVTRPPNARWSAPMQTAARGEPWGADDVDMLVTVEGWADDPALFSAGAAMPRIHEVRFTMLSTAERTAPVDDVLKMQELGACLVIRPQDQAGLLTATEYAPLPMGGRQRVATKSFFPDGGTAGAIFGSAFPSLSSAQRTRASSLMVETALGHDVREHAVWGTSSSSFTPPELLLMRTSMLHQKLAAGVSLGVLFILSLALWTRVWWIGRRAAHAVECDSAPTTNPRSE